NNDISYEVKASLKGKSFTYSLKSGFANAGLDKEISMSDRAKTLENAARTVKWHASKSTFGCDQYGKPPEEIDYDVKADYHDWDYGSYYVKKFISSINFKPK
ncbi:MAG: hypothetical protein Q8N63_09190, partial [Nanoarchaeota archaeon]|nr:hypothetical protein [Nanoarchaeota archaeon]